MNKIFALLLFLIVYSVAIVESQEICESYNTLWSTNDAQNCSMYCCGSCNDRFCCNSLANRLDQTLCTPEDCNSYYDSYGNYYSLSYCFEQFCCGNCDYRYCCSFPTSRLNQSSCPVGTPSTKRTTTVYPSTSTLNTLLYFIAGIIGGICLSLLVCYILIVTINKSKRRVIQTVSYNNNNEINSAYPKTQPINGYDRRYNNSYPTDNNAQSNTRSAFFVADNSAYNYDMNKIYNPSINDDLPPNYDTTNLQQKNTGESNETNF